MLWAVFISSNLVYCSFNIFKYFVFNKMHLTAFKNYILGINIIEA